MIQYLNVFFYDIYPYICATVFFLGSGCAMTTDNIPGARRPARCWISVGW